jgi:hypothetical protein
MYSYIGVSSTIPRIIGVTMDTNDDDDSEVTSYVTDSQMHSKPGDGGHDMKRKYDELLIEIAKLRKAEEKRKKRKPKRSDKGESFKRLCNIPIESQVTETTAYVIAKMTRKILWRNMKYFNEFYKDDCLQMSFKRLGYTQDKDREKYADHVIFYIDQKLTTCRNNTIYILKKLVMENTDGGKLKDIGGKDAV